MPDPLTKAELLALHRAWKADPASRWPWIDHMEARLAVAPDLQDHAQREALWTSNELGQIGNGNAVPWRAVLDDEAWTERLAELQGRALPAEDMAAAKVLDAAWSSLLDALPRSPQRPQARLHRALAALRPHEITTLYQETARERVAELVVGRRAGLGRLGQQLLICRKLAEVLPPAAREARTLAERNAFLWWLYERYDALGDPEFKVVPATTPPAAWPSLAELRAALADLVLPEAELAVLHHTWTRPDAGGPPPRRLVLLAGLSGTGKTRMTLGYARVVCDLMGLDPAAHVVLAAVSPAWDDPTGLLGYANPLAQPPAWVTTPVTELLRRAAADPDRPYFLLLDEMNLARVERYLAPLLSAMELPEGQIELHGLDVPGVPRALHWPRNLRVAGTVNLDETTFPFSDKVLDRAVTLESWDADLEAWSALRGGAAVLPALQALYAALRPCRRHFGYRTADEVLQLWQGGVSLDDAVRMKVLPRVRGQEADGLDAALTALIKAAGEHGLPRTAERCRRMQQQLQATGLCSFWGTG